MSDLPFTGGCACGAIRYEISEKPVATAYCHCRDCQRSAGGPFSVVTLIKTEAISISGAEPKRYTVKGTSGSQVSRMFCGECGSPLFTSVDNMPNLWIVKVGSLDNPNSVKPNMHVWTERALEWAPYGGVERRFEREPG